MHKGSAGVSSAGAAPLTAGSPAHALRMRWRTDWVRTCPKGADWTRIVKNLRAFIPLLVDFADADGSNRKPPGQALIADNLSCAPETAAVLYEAAEAMGLISCRRSPKGRVNGYTLLPHLPGWVPDWEAARAALESDRRIAYKRKIPTRVGNPDASETPTQVGFSEDVAEPGFPTCVASDSRHMSEQFPTQVGTTRGTTSLNHDMTGVSTAGAGPRARGESEGSSRAADPLVLPGVDDYAARLAVVAEGGRPVPGAVVGEEHQEQPEPLADPAGPVAPDSPGSLPLAAVGACQGVGGRGCEFERPAVSGGRCGRHLVEAETGLPGPPLAAVVRPQTRRAVVSR